MSGEVKELVFVKGAQVISHTWTGTPKVNVKYWTPTKVV